MSKEAGRKRRALCRLLEPPSARREIWRLEQLTRLHWRPEQLVSLPNLRHCTVAVADGQHWPIKRADAAIAIACSLVPESATERASTPAPGAVLRAPRPLSTERPPALASCFFLILPLRRAGQRRRCTTRSWRHRRACSCTGEVIAASGDAGSS